MKEEASEETIMFHHIVMNRMRNGCEQSCMTERAYEARGQRRNSYVPYHIRVMNMNRPRMREEVGEERTMFCHIRVIGMNRVQDG